MSETTRTEWRLQTRMANDADWHSWPTRDSIEEVRLDADYFKRSGGAECRIIRETVTTTREVVG